MQLTIVHDGYITTHISFCAMYKSDLSKDLVEEMIFFEEDQSCQSWRRTAVPFTVAEKAPGIFVP